MLNALRNAAGTWVAKLLLVILVVSFAVWGISGQIGTGFGGNSVVTAGGTSVSATEYRLTYDRQLNVMSQQFGQRLTREQAQALGIDTQVLAQLITGAVLDEQARLMGLGLSKDRLAQLTMEDPAFQGVNGQFDRQAFEYVLRQIGMRPEDYFKNRAQVAVRQQIVEAVSDGLKTPDTFLRAVALYRGEDRTVDYVSIPKSLVEPVEAPADGVLAAWFEKNKADYSAPEYRKISYIKLEPEDIADESAIGDEQVAADYERNKARFTTPETRTIEQIVFASSEDAQTALDAIGSGSTFESIVANQGKTAADTLLGTFTRANVPDPAIAEAAFSLTQNQVSGIVQGSFGPVLVRVTAISPEVVRTLAEVSAEIRRDLAIAEASRVLLDVHDEYEDARAGGATMREAAERLKLKVVTVEAIDRAAQLPDGTVYAELPQSRELLAGAFETETNIENAPLNLGSSGFVFYEVEGITPARDRTLDEVRDKAVADWTVQETSARLKARADEFAKRLKDGAALEAIATELATEKQTKRGVRRDADDPDFGKEGVAVVFGMAQGGTGVFEAPSGEAYVLFRVTEVFEPAGADASAVPQDAQDQFASGLSDDLLDQLVANLESQYQVQVDYDAIQRAQSF